MSGDLTTSPLFMLTWELKTETDSIFLTMSNNSLSLNLGQLANTVVFIHFQTDPVLVQSGSAPSYTLFSIIIIHTRFTHNLHTECWWCSCKNHTLNTKKTYVQYHTKSGLRGKDGDISVTVHVCAFEYVWIHVCSVKQVCVCVCVVQQRETFHSTVMVLQSRHHREEQRL